MAKLTLPEYASNGPTPTPENPDIIARVDPSAAFQAQEQQGDQEVKTSDVVQEMYDKTSVNNAYVSTFAPNARNIENEYRQLQGKDAIDKFPEYQQKMVDLQNITKDSLTGRQQELFNSLATAHTERALDTMGSYQDTQKKAFAEKTNSSMLDNFVSDSAAHYNDPTYFGQNLFSGYKEIEGYGAQTGMSTDEIQKRKVDFGNKMITAKYNAQAQFDPEGALAGFRAEMNKVQDPALQAQTSAQLQSAVQPGRATSTADNVMRGGSMTDFNALSDAVIQKESAGRSDALNMSSSNGKPSIGLMQLQPDTARQVAGELGLVYDQDRLQKDPAYNKALGQKYLSDMVDRYSGNQTLALAAYNAGPQNVDSWISKFGDPRNGSISDQDFTSKIPFAETKDYVTTINGKVPPLAGVPPLSTDPGAHLTDWQANVSKMPDGPVKDMASASLDAKVGQVQQVQTANDANNSNALLKGLTSGQITTPADLQNPAYQQAWVQASPEVQKHLLSAIKEGKNNTDTADSFRIYNELMGEAAADPDGFAKLDLNQYYGKVPTAKLDQLAGIRSSIVNQQTKATEQTVPYARLKELADPIVRSQLNIDPDAKKGTGDSKLWYNYVGRLSQEVEDFKTTNKKVPSDSDIQNMATKLLAPVAQDKTSMFGLFHSTSSTPAFEVKPQDIPDSDKAMIIPALQKVFGRPPTDREMLSAYLRKRQG